MKEKVTDRRKETEYIRKPNTKHARMPVRQRAKQFMPFQAVTGFEEALRIKEQEWLSAQGEHRQTR